MSLEKLNQVFNNLKIDAKCVNHYTTSSSNFYDVELGNKTTINKFSSLIKDIELRIKANSGLFLQIVPGDGILKIQDVNKNINQFYFKDLTSLKEESNFILGKDYHDNMIQTDFKLHPHTLIAGATGSGKSMALHHIICNALMEKDSEVWLSDPKNVEFSIYKDVKNVKYFASSYQANLDMLEWLTTIMESRFNVLSWVRANSYKNMPGMGPIFVIIDELADLILQDESQVYTKSLLRLSQKCRAAGIFIVAATQRPSVDILSGPIKANFPARIALKTSSVIDSKVILDQSGAEILKGQGDAIIKNDQYNFTRFKFSFIEPIKFVNNI